MSLMMIDVIDLWLTWFKEKEQGGWNKGHVMHLQWRHLKPLQDSDRWILMGVWEKHLPHPSYHQAPRHMTRSAPPANTEQNCWLQVDAKRKAFFSPQKQTDREIESFLSCWFTPKFTPPAPSGQQGLSLLVGDTSSLAKLCEINMQNDFDSPPHESESILSLKMLHEPETQEIKEEGIKQKHAACRGWRWWISKCCIFRPRSPSSFLPGAAGGISARSWSLSTSCHGGWMWVSHQLCPHFKITSLSLFLSLPSPHLHLLLLLF